MTSLSRTSTLTAALLALAVPVAVADKPDKPSAPAKPSMPAKPEQPGSPAQGQEHKAGKDERVPRGQAKKEQAVALPVPLPAAAPPAAPGPKHPEHTAFGRTVAAAATSGAVTVRLPGSDEFVALPTDAPLPVGASIDASDGLVEIGSETGAGVEQHAVVTGSVFRVEQDPAAGGVTDLVLEGGEFDACGARAAKTARAAARRRGKRKGTVVRGLWAAGKGQFRTRGRKSVASVRGTRWAVVDRCHSTTVRVFDGVVDVRDMLTGKTVVLRAGDRHVTSDLRRR